MKSRRLDPETGDIVTNGLQFIDGREEVAQTIKTRLALFYGEYFRDITDGTPWFQEILGKFASIGNVENILRARIAETPGVIRLTSFSSNFDPVARKFSVSAGALTEYGLAEIEFNG